MKTMVEESVLLAALPQLCELQEIDLQIKTQLDERAELDDGSLKQAELDRANTRKTKLSHDLSELRGRQIDRRLERDSLQQRRERNQHRLWQENPTQQEAEALQKDLQSTANRLDQIEIELQDLDNRIGPLEDQVEDEQRTVSELEAELAEVRQEFDENVKGIDVDLERLLTERATKQLEVPADLLERYERIRRRRGDPGVVKVTEDVCGHCNTLLTSYMLRQLHYARHVQQCENCNTILHWAGEVRPVMAFDDLREVVEVGESFDDEE
ncbi:MAG: hypothetical protein IT204_21910 [Fimbriimonadaceae bacterium]|nr:hypothetical protein [Fimbriimonadaceae bacterium]